MRFLIISPYSLLYVFQFIRSCLYVSSVNIEKENNHYSLVTMTFYIHKTRILDSVLFVYWDVYMEEWRIKQI